MSKDGRYRNWTFIVYPDSAPADWQEKLRTSGVPGYISPQHNRDHNPDGTAKKPHWHVVLAYRGLHPEKDAQEISDAISGVRVQHVKDIRSMARYLCHLDNPEKASYSPSDVISFGGADYLTAVASAADTDAVLGEMLDFCETNDISSFYRLSLYARKNRPDWFRVLTTQRTVFLTNYLKSRRYERMEEEATGKFSDLTRQHFLLKASSSGDSREAAKGTPEHEKSGTNR